MYNQEVVFESQVNTTNFEEEVQNPPQQSSHYSCFVKGLLSPSWGMSVQNHGLLCIVNSTPAVFFNNIIYLA